MNSCVVFILKQRIGRYWEIESLWYWILYLQKKFEAFKQKWLWLLANLSVFHTY